MSFGPENYADVLVAVIAVAGVIAGAFISTRKRSARIEKRQIGIEENLRPSNGDTLAQTVEMILEGQGRTLDAMLQGQHQIGERIDQVRLDVNAHQDEMRFENKNHLNSYRHERRLVEEDLP